MYINSQLEPLKAKSPWGSIAAFFMLQAFGFFIFHSFVFFLMSPLGLFGLLWGLCWLFVFIVNQSIAFAEISNFFKEKDLTKELFPPKNLRELIKIVFAIVFLSIFVLFLIGFYPFPQKEYSLLWLVLFYPLSWGISAITKKASARTTTGSGLVFGLLISLFMFLMSFLFMDFFYFFGLASLGTFVLLMSGWLLR